MGWSAKGAQQGSSWLLRRSQHSSRIRSTGTSVWGNTDFGTYPLPNWLQTRVISMFEQINPVVVLLSEEDVQHFSNRSDDVVSVDAICSFDLLLFPWLVGEQLHVFCVWMMYSFLYMLHNSQWRERERERRRRRGEQFINNYYSFVESRKINKSKQVQNLQSHSAAAAVVE